MEVLDEGSELRAAIGYDEEYMGALVFLAPWDRTFAADMSRHRRGIIGWG